MEVTQYAECIEYHVEQNTPEWLDMRRGRLTASAADKVVCGAEVTYCKLTREPTEEDVENIGRSKKALEVIEIMKGSQQMKKDLNASGIKKLFDLGLAEEVKDVNAVRLSSGAHAHARRLCVEMHFTGEELGDKSFSNFAMEQGNEKEDDTRKAFEAHTGLKVREAGFCINKEHPLLGNSPDGVVENIAENEGVELKTTLPQTQFKRLLKEPVLPSEYKQQIHESLVVTGFKRWHFFSYCEGYQPIHIIVERDKYTENLKAVLVEFTGILKHYQGRHAAVFAGRN